MDKKVKFMYFIRKNNFSFLILEIECYFDISSAWQHIKMLRKISKAMEYDME